MTPLALPLPRSRALLRDETLAVTLCGLLLTWLWVMAVGRDISWDVVNHHLYLPWSLLSGHYRTDLFAAGPQSYQNPLGFLPFYALVRGGLPSWAVGTGLALLHGLAFWPLHRLTLAIWGDGADQRWWRLVAVALAGATPIFLLLAGTSSVDPLSAVLVLAALAALFPAHRGIAGPLWSGLWMGLAFTVKPSNAAFVLAAAAVLLLQWAAGQRGWREPLSWALASLLAVAATMGFWSIWLWQTFGNPLFPLFNQWFHSPYAPQQAIIGTRFLPTSALDWLVRPWQLAQYQTYGSTEAIAPDLRPLAAALSLVPAIVLTLKRGVGGGRAAARRADVQLLLFGLCGYALWLMTSGNARYGVPGFMLTGLVLTRAAQLALPRAVARIGLGVLLALQLAYYGVDGDHRIAPQAWDQQPFLQLDLAPRLVNEPFLHLSVGTQTYAGLAPFLHPDGAMVNVVGQMSLPGDGPLAAALQQRLQRWQGRTRFLFRAAGVESAEAAAQLPAAQRQRADGLIARFGLRIDFDDCLRAGIARQTLTGLHMIPVMSCGALPAPVAPPTAHEQLAAEVFHRLETLCPRVYGPSPLATDGAGDVLQRLYLNSDLRVTVSRDDGVLVSHHRSANLLRLGSAAEVAAGSGADPCLVWRRLDVQQGLR